MTMDGRYLTIPYRIKFDANTGGPVNISLLVDIRTGSVRDCAPIC